MSVRASGEAHVLAPETCMGLFRQYHDGHLAMNLLQQHSVPHLAGYKHVLNQNQIFTRPSEVKKMFSGFRSR